MTTIANIMRIGLRCQEFPPNDCQNIEFCTTDIEIIDIAFQIKLLIYAHKKEQGIILLVSYMAK